GEVARPLHRRTFSRSGVGDLGAAQKPVPRTYRPAAPDFFGLIITPPALPVSAIRVWQNILFIRERISAERHANCRCKLLGRVELAVRQQQHVHGHRFEADDLDEPDVCHALSPTIERGMNAGCTTLFSSTSSCQRDAS